MTPPFRLIGTPRFGGIVVVADHAANHVPDDIDLGIDPALLEQHIAVDIGVNAVTELLAERPGIAAHCATSSRLVCDLNREEHSAALFPIASDGHAIPGNMLDEAERAARLERFYLPYHDALARLLDETPPALILSLHSFTPRLASDEALFRPWQVGVLYNADERAARLALPLLAAEGLVVGDQQPYSGKLLNATMNRHAEAEGRPYLGIEIRQDQIADRAGQAAWAERLARLCNRVAIALG
jgi:predicted N-formylglutamate amidohydrolase